MRKSLCAVAAFAVAAAWLAPLAMGLTDMLWWILTDQQLSVIDWSDKTRAMASTAWVMLGGFIAVPLAVVFLEAGE